MMYSIVTCEDGKKTLVNIDKIKCVSPILIGSLNSGGSCIDFGNGDYFNCKEEFESIFDDVTEIYGDKNELN